MHPYHQEGLHWKNELAACSDEELVSRHNQAVGLRCFGLARQMYLGCLEREILAREFDSSILFAHGKDATCRLAFKARIVNNHGVRALAPACAPDHKSGQETSTWRP